MCSKENQEILVICEILKHLDEIRMFSIQSREVQFVVKMIDQYLIQKDFDLVKLRDTKYDSVKNIIFRIVTACSDEEAKDELIVKVINYLLRNGDMI